MPGRIYVGKAPVPIRKAAVGLPSRGKTCSLATAFPRRCPTPHRSATTNQEKTWRQDR